jgi:hypothetical protein
MPRSIRGERRRLRPGARLAGGPVPSQSAVGTSSSLSGGGSPMSSISVILAVRDREPERSHHHPHGVTAPMAAFTSAGRTSRARCPKASACFRQTAAPRTSAGGPNGTGTSVRTTKSGSRTARRPSKSRLHENHLRRMDLGLHEIYVSFFSLRRATPDPPTR